jgi:hypothetical protein
MMRGGGACGWAGIWARAWATLSLVLGVAAALLAPGPSDAVALWTDPVVLFSTDRGDVRSPVLVADPEGGVHLFFPYSETASDDGVGGLGAPGQLRSPSMLRYARLQDGRWSIPVDVLTSSDSSGMDQPDVSLDPRGYLHVIWKRTNGAELEYSRAHVSHAASPVGWTQPVQLTRGSIAPGGFGRPAAITAADDASLHLVYAASEGGIYYRRSDDGGKSWLPAVTVTDKGGPDVMPDIPRIAVDGQRRLHVTWTNYAFPKGWPPRSTASSSSSDGGQTWTDPVPMAGEKYGLATMAIIMPHSIHRVWNSTAVLPERRHQWSADGGTTWTSPANISPPLGGGFTGFPSLAVDGAGRLHLITSVASPPGVSTTEVVYHLEWDGTSWSRPTYLSKGAVGSRSVEQPSSAISEGNRLHAAWEDDFKRIWYTSRLLDAPTLPTQHLSPPPLQAAPDTQPVPSHKSPPPPRHATSPISPAEFPATVEPGPTLLAATLPTAILLGVFLVVRAKRSA